MYESKAFAPPSSYPVTNPVKLVWNSSIRFGCSRHAVAVADGWSQEYRVGSGVVVLEVEEP